MSTETAVAAKTPIEDLRRSALEHYDKLSTQAHEWMNTIPRAINEFYDREAIREAASSANEGQATARLAKLEAIPHSPADDGELCGYAAGVVTGIMRDPTPNCVGSILARVRQDSAKIEELKRQIEQLRAALKLWAPECEECDEIGTWANNDHDSTWWHCDTHKRYGDLQDGDAVAARAALLLQRKVNRRDRQRN